MYNAFFMDLPVSSFVSHSSLLTAKSVNLAVACDGFPLKEKLPVFFIVAILIVEVLFEQFLIHTTVQWVEHSRQRSVMDTSLFR